MNVNKEIFIKIKDIFRTDLNKNFIISNERHFSVPNCTQIIFNNDKNHVSQMNRKSTEDVLDSVQRIHKLIDSIEQKQFEIEKAWINMEKNIDKLKEIDNLEEDVSNVTNWILGPADSMLNNHFQIGFDVASSDDLRQEHEKLELECREAYGKYAELLHKIDNISNDHMSEDLKSQRDFMDFVCRSFATRLERRRNMLITSQRFFRLVSQYFDKTSEVFDKLIMGSRACDLSNAGYKLIKLECSQRKLEELEKELIKQGEKLSDILSMPVKDALCRDVRIDYGEDIINIQDILDATNARKNIFNDSVELQKLTLKQIALIYTYENDSEQAIRWLNDLFDVLVGSYIEIGCNLTEIQVQKQEHQSFQDTAKGTYEYGCQLINGARVLRISCKLDLLSNIALLSRLRQIWRQLRSISQEQLTRLRVCAVFHRNVSDHCTKLREMIDRVRLFTSKRNTLAMFVSKVDVMESTVSNLRPKPEIRNILGKRENLLSEVGRMVRLGRLLRSRLKEPLIYQRMMGIEEIGVINGNLSAVQSISAKLLEVTRLAEKLDAKLCEAGARTRILDSIGNETAKLELDLSLEKTTGSKQGNRKGQIQLIGESDHDIVDHSNVEEYVNASDCCSTSVLGSRIESFLSSEYEDALVSTTCRKPAKEIEKKNELLPVANKEVILAVNINNKKDDIKYDFNEATVIDRILQNEKGKIIKEITKTTTLRILQDTCINVAAYKIVTNSISEKKEKVNLSHLEGCDHNVINGELVLTTDLELEDTNNSNINASRKDSCESSLVSVPMDTMNESNRYCKDELLAVGRVVSEDIDQENHKDLPKQQVNATTPELID